MLGSPEIDWAGDEVEDVNNNYDFETEDEVKDDFSYHQFQDVAYNYWRHLSKLTCMTSLWFSRRFVVFYCLTTNMFLAVQDSSIGDIVSQ